MTASVHESVGVAIVVVVGFLIRYSWWVRPRGRRAPVEVDQARFDFRNTRDVVTIVVLAIGTVVGVVLVVGGLLSKSY